MKYLLAFIICSFWACTEKQFNFQTCIVDLSNQQLIAIPDSVLANKNITHLYLGNAFTLYPPLSALKKNDIGLTRDANRITELPALIGQLKNLRVFDINRLKTLPEEISMLNNLDSLYLSFNGDLILLNELPKPGKLKQLRYMDVAGIQFDAKSLQQLKTFLPKTQIISSIEDKMSGIQ